MHAYQEAILEGREPGRGPRETVGRNQFLDDPDDIDQLGG